MGYATGETIAGWLAIPSVTEVRAIEINSVVIDAAKQCFGGRWQANNADARFTLEVDEFRRWLRAGGEGAHYDVIHIDNSFLEPFHAGFFTLEFFQQVRARLAPGGVYAMDILADVDAGPWLRTAIEAFGTYGRSVDPTHPAFVRSRFLMFWDSPPARSFGLSHQYGIERGDWVPALDVAPLVTDDRIGGPAPRPVAFDRR
jgi:spermidine synthase